MKPHLMYHITFLMHAVCTVYSFEKGVIRRVKAFVYVVNGVSSQGGGDDESSHGNGICLQIRVFMNFHYHSKVLIPFNFN